MSYEDGWAAVNLEMPPRVPRFDPSAESYHLPLINAIVGSNLTLDTPWEKRQKATRAFVKAWDYGIMLSSTGPDLSPMSTSMGHAEYALEGSDYDDNLYCPFKTVEEVLNFQPEEVYGLKDHAELVKLHNDHFHMLSAAYPDCVNTSGIYVTMMSGMIAIFGWDMLLKAAAESQERFGELITRYAKWIAPYYAAAADSDTVCFYSHDDMVWTEGAFIHPDWYRKYIFPNLKMLWAPLVEAGKKVIFVCDGNYTEFLDDVVACGNAGFWFEIFTDLEQITTRFGKTHFIIGNGDCRVLTFGTKEDVRDEVKRCMDLGKKCPGYFMGISGHIPPNVPLENALYYDEVYREMRVR